MVWLNLPPCGDHLPLWTDNSVLKGFWIGDRCSFFHMALIERILRNPFVYLFSRCRIQGVTCEYSKILCDPAENLWVLLQRKNEQTKVCLSINQCHVEKMSIYHPPRSPLVQINLHKVLSSFSYTSFGWLLWFILAVQWDNWPFSTQKGKCNYLTNILGHLNAHCVWFRLNIME